MKKISTLIIFIVVLSLNSHAQTYSITSNATWGTAPCTSNCTFNISGGVTVTINNAFTCATCTFNGGKIVIDQNLVCQPCTFSGNTITLNSAELKPNSSISSFTNVTLSATGTADILANTAVNITNSTFTFNNNSYFNNNSSTLDITNSTIYLYDASYFNANGGPVNLISSSRFVVGNGSTSSTSYVKMNGPTLNIYDNSSITLANKNNYYFDWGTFNYYTSTAAAAHTTYTTTGNNLNCGGAGQNACSAPDAFGSATLNSSGLSAGAILPVTLDGFSGYYNTNNTVSLSWSTAASNNFDHFIIERSSNAADWQTAGTVASKVYASVATYSFVDASPLDNQAYYRLQMVDDNGTISYSKIIEIKTGAAVKQVSIFPNPAINSTINIRLTSTDAAVANVFTMSGQLLFTAVLKGQMQYQVKLPNALPNNYLVIQVISNGKTNSFSILNK